MGTADDIGQYEPWSERMVLDALFALTEAGVYSEIVYDKKNGDPPMVRVVEPRKLVESRDVLMVSCFQLEPERGVRTFMISRIASVTPTNLEIPEARRKTNQFLTGEVVSFAKSDSEALQEHSSTPGESFSDRPRRVAWSSPWFIEYSTLVRQVLLDLQVSPIELKRVQKLQRDLGLCEEQIRSVHAYLFAEEMTSYASDGWLDDAEQDYLMQMATCLRILGWCPPGFTLA